MVDMKIKFDGNIVWSHLYKLIWHFMIVLCKYTELTH